MSQVLYEWEFVNYICRVVESEPGIVHFEQARKESGGDPRVMEFRRTATPMGAANEIIQLHQALGEAKMLNRDLVERWYPRPTAAPGAQHLDRPLRWRKPRHGILTNDLFDGSLSNEAIAAVFGVMAACQQHTFQILTKRPERMRRWFEWVAKELRGEAAMLLDGAADALGLTVSGLREFYALSRGASWPLPNVWLGVSVENQATADERIPLLLKTPAALRFVSYEPALGPVDFDVARYGESNFLRGLHWLIFGGESGPGRREMKIEWIENIARQCDEAGVPLFVKQDSGPRPGMQGRISDALWARKEFPAVRAAREGE